MKNRIDLRTGQRLQLFAQTGCGCEHLDGRGFAFTAPGGLLAAKQGHAMTFVGEECRQFGAQPPSGEIREAPHLVQWFVGRSSRNDAIHPVQPTEYSIAVSTSSS